MIATLAEIKTLLGITSTTYDARINANIPIIEQDICDICNQDFIDIDYSNVYGNNFNIYTYKDTLSFINADNSINDSESKFIDNGFKIADSIRIYFSKNNDQIFTIKTITDSKIVFEDIDEVIDEAASTSSCVMMIRLLWPKPLKKVVADMANFSISKNNKFVKSENIGNYSYTNADEFISGYPKNIIQKLYKYRSIIAKNINTLPLCFYKK